MKRKYVIFTALLALLLPWLAWAQNATPVDMTGEATEETTPKKFGEYQVSQSIEFGDRIADIEGNQQAYDTFTNIHSGPRLLSQELSMQAAPGTGNLFDDLYLSSFGFGGDPNDLARLRVSKAKWYNFVAMYRRDQNYWDYDLFGNPLTASPVLGVASSGLLNPAALPWYANSTRYQDETRNMGDAMLTLFPTSAVSVRLGYNQNNNAGFFGSTLESGPYQIGENAGWRAYRYQVGVDVKVLPKTTISLDEFYAHDTTDLAYLNNLSLLTLGTSGIGVSPATLFSDGFSPLTTSKGVTTSNGCYLGTGTGALLTSTGAMANNPSCSALVAFSKLGDVRTDIPTTRLALRSNAFPKLDLTADGTYSDSHSNFPGYNEFTHNLTGTSTLAFGEPFTKTVTDNADLGLTYHFTHMLSFDDKFRWLDWREGGNSTIDTLGCAIPPFPTAPLTGTVLTSVVSPCNPALAGLLALSGQGVSSLASSSTFSYLSTVTNLGLLAQREYFNTASIQVQPNRHVSGFVGFRYGRRELTTGSTPSQTGDQYFLNTATFTTTAGSTAPPTVAAPCTSSTCITGVLYRPRINQYTGLAGVVIRPIDALRINGDAEITYADNAFENLYPRHEQKGRLMTTYRVNRWASVNASVNAAQDLNNFAQNYLGSGANLFPSTVAPAYGSELHYQYYSLGTTLTPASHFTLDTGWTYMDQRMNTATCLPETTGLSATVLVSPDIYEFTSTSPTCPAISSSLIPVPLQSLANSGGVPVTLNYTERTNSFYANLAFHPVKRVKVNMGYQITSTNGNTGWIRADTGLPLEVYGDLYGNALPLGYGAYTTFNPASPTGCNGTKCVVYLGPNPNQPSGPQIFNWHTPSAGLEIALAKGVAFKGNWAYYDYNTKEIPGVVGALGGTGLSILPTNFHANVGTLALKYSF